jgi:hypothetical protein
MALALLASVLCNPKLIKNIFLNRRGIQAMENAVNNAAFFKSLQIYIDIISDSLFNSHMGIILVVLSLTTAILALTRCGLLKKRGNITFLAALKDTFRPASEGHGRFFVWCACFATSIAYTIIIARIAPYRRARYILCAMPMLALTLTAALEFIRARLHINRAVYAAVAAVLAVALCFASMPGQLNHLYRFSSEHYAMIDEYNELPLIVVIKKGKRHDLSKIHMEIMAQDKQIYVTTSEQLDMLEFENHIPYTSDGVIVYVSNNLDEKKAIEDTARAARLPYIEKLFYQRGFTTYRLYD